MSSLPNHTIPTHLEGLIGWGEESVCSRTLQFPSQARVPDVLGPFGGTQLLGRLQYVDQRFHCGKSKCEVREERKELEVGERVGKYQG